jgi:hypothetical protein
MIEIKSTREAMEEFKGSLIWADIVDELTEWKESFSREQDSIVDDAADNNPSTASVLLHMGDLNGRKKAIDYVLNILDMFLSILEDEEDGTGRDETD